MQTFDLLIAEFPQHAHLANQVKTYFNSRYWYQFGETLVALTSFPEIQNSDFSLTIFETVFDNPTINLDKITMALLANRAADRIQGIDAKLAFYARLDEFVKHPKAQLLLQSHKAACLTIAGKKVEALEILRSLEPQIAALHNSDKVLYSTFFKSLALYYLKEGDFQKFYSASLQYLGYVNENEISDFEKEDICVNMAVAILVSEKIYNFSELRVFQSLKTNQKFSWLYEIMETFNKGDIAQFHKDVQRFATHIASLVARTQVLEQKIKIMAFAELVFSLPKNERTVTFAQIQTSTGIDTDMIELMIIKAMSLDLLRGSIDEVAQTVTISWIQPRVLDKERISKMRTKYETWNAGLGQLLAFIEDYHSSL